MATPERVPITHFQVSTFTIPTETPESDGTLDWSSTSLILVELKAGGQWGLGYTYANPAFAKLVEALIPKAVMHENALDIAAIWGKLVHLVRNDGEMGATAMAISAIDNALWDLKAKILALPLASLFGQCRPAIEIYGSGGFTSYTSQQLQHQIQNWQKSGITKFKMKVGTHPEADLGRVRFARECIGESAELFVDANGAYDYQMALSFADEFAKQKVTWFEEPIPPGDVKGMKELKASLPHGMNLAVGEYIYDSSDLLFRLNKDFEDFIQLDTTRCKGMTSFLKMAAACEIHYLPISSHCAPSMHIALACALPGFRHLEYFFDHSRIEAMLFDGAVQPVKGMLAPDLSRPGVGLELKRADAERYRV
jgi:L-alanine-DL-glutamate epimerase-like enolase superfamily enzyme